MTGVPKFITMVQIIHDVNLKYSLLGRDFIFSRVDITFRERKNRVEFLRKNNDGIEKISPINR